MSKVEWEHDGGRKQYTDTGEAGQAQGALPVAQAPPQDLSAEQAVLGAMLLERETLEVGCAMLTPEDLYSPQVTRCPTSSAISIAAEARGRMPVHYHESA